MATGELEQERGQAGRAAICRGALLAVALQWSLRFIGLISVFILARLLSPHDFGIVGLAMATVALVEIFSVIGLRQALLRIPVPDREHLDTAWTIQLLLFSGLGLLVVALAPLAARFYGEPALAPVIAVLASRFLFLGLVNIGIVEFDRELAFGRDLRMRVGARLVSFAATIAAALLLRSYWALVIGLVAQSVLFAGASWLAHPYRPRLSLARRGELLGVSVWMFLNFAAQIVHFQVERLVVGRFGAMHLLGLYSVSKDLSSIFTQEIAVALNRVTFVTTARGRPLAEAPERMIVMLGAYAMIAAPLGLGLAAAAEDVVAVLLGGQWLAAAPLLQLVAPASACYAVYKLIASSLQASGLERRAALMTCAGAAAAAAAAVGTALAGGGASAIAATALVVAAALLSAGLLVIARVAAVAAVGLAAAVARPFAAAAAMLVLVRLAGPDTGLAAVDLMLEVALGAGAYAGGLYLLWMAAGRPAGAEAEAAALLDRFAWKPLGAAIAQRRRARRRT